MRYNPRGIRRFTFVRIAFALGGVVIFAFTAAGAALGLWRWPPRLVELYYPVVAIRGDDTYAFVAPSARLLKDPRPDWADAPKDGTLLIDSDFNLYEERDVHISESELGWLFRKYVGPERPATYSISLKRCWWSGRDVALARLAKCQTFASGGEPARVRKSISTQTEMSGIIALIDHPTVVPVSVQPATTQTAPEPD